MPTRKGGHFYLGWRADGVSYPEPPRVLVFECRIREFEASGAQPGFPPLCRVRRLWVTIYGRVPGLREGTTNQ
jgi:hypothetical protein